MFIVKFLVSAIWVALGWMVVKKVEPGYVSGKKLTKGIVTVIAFLLITSFLYPDILYQQKGFLNQEKAVMMFHQEETWLSLLAGSIFWATLALAAFCDSYTREIYDFCYFPWLGMGGVLLFFSAFDWPELLVFIFLQAMLFQKMYGISDCIAFVACAIYMAVQGKGLLNDLMLMAVTFLLLALIQLMKRNVNRRGNLKKPVPLIPYIAAAMAVVEMF